MKKLKDFIKELSFVKKLRTRKKVNYYGRRYILPEKSVKRAENDMAYRKLAVARQTKKWPEKTSVLTGKIREVLAAGYYEGDSEELAADMLFCYFAYGFSPNEYLCYELNKKSVQERRSFVSDRESVCYGYLMNDIDQMRVFRNKMQSYEKFKNYYKREAISIAASQDKEKYLDFVKRHPVFVKKRVGESCGRSVELIDTNSADKEQLFESLILDGEMILEEQVIQTGVLKQLNGSSVNTVRCITLNTGKGIYTPFCFLKVGRKGAFVDNGGAGGILVGIDSKSGTLNTDGVDEVNHCYSIHPDSKVKFKGLQLPEWEQMISVCREMALQIEKVRFIGWDMAYSDKGWVVIEGNALSEVIGPQATSKKGIRKELNNYITEMGVKM